MFGHQRPAKFALYFLLATGLSQAQDISDELNSLDDFPADDATPNASPPDAAPTDDLSLDDSPPSDTPSDAVPESDDFPTDDAPQAEDDSLSDLDSLDSETDTKDLGTDNLEKPEEAQTGIDTEGAATVNALNFRQLTDRVRIIVSASRSIDFARELRSRRRQVIVELRNAKIANKLLKRTIDTGEFDGPVALVQAFPSTVGSVGSVKVLIQLRKMSDPKITRQKNELLIDFALGTTDKRLFKDQAREKVQLPETFLGINEGIKFFGSRISLNAKDAELPDMIQTISKVANRNFTLDPSAQGKKVTLNVKDVPWDQVLALILQNNDLGYQKVGNVYRIVPVSKLKTEIDEAIRAAKANVVLAPQETRIFPINYATATEINVNVLDLLTKGEAKGTSTIEARTNSLVVTDNADTLNKVAEYIASVDRQTAQIQIEGRIVEASEEFSKSLGVQWKVGEFSGGTFQGSFVNVGAAGSALETTPAGNQLAATGNNGGARIRMGNLGSLGTIQALLQLAEKRGESKIISSPRVVVQDTKTAVISSSDSTTIPGASTATGTSNSTTVTADTALNVTPRVTADGFVNLKINLRRQNLNGTNIKSKSADTELLVESGKTAVIGGIYEVKSDKTDTGWPLLNRLPILGTLFRDTSVNSNTVTELLMFISPKILNADRAFLSYKEGLNLNEKKSDEEAELDAELSGDDLKALEGGMGNPATPATGEELTL
jgi:type IV pilus assembly protein PilQ